MRYPTKSFILLLSVLCLLNVNSAHVTAQANENAAGRSVTVAVITFQTLPEALKDNQWLGAGMSEDLSDRLDAAEFESLSVYDRRAASRITRKVGGAQGGILPDNTAHIMSLKQEVESQGVDYLVVGSIQSPGKWDSPDATFILNAQIVAVRDIGDKGLISDAVNISGAFGAGGAGLFAAQTELSEKVARALGVVPEDYKGVPLSRGRTHNLQAFKSYSQGIMAFDAGDYDTAKRLFFKAYQDTGGAYHAALLMYEKSDECRIEELESGGAAGDEIASEIQAGDKLLEELEAKQEAHLATIKFVRAQRSVWKQQRYLDQGDREKADDQGNRALEFIEAFNNLNRNKAVIWSSQTGSGLRYGFPLVSGDTVYVSGVRVADMATMDIKGITAALDLKTGDTLWEHEHADFVGDTLELTDDILFAVSLNLQFDAGKKHSRLHALDRKTGEELWSYGIDDHFKTKPAVSGNVVVISKQDVVYALNASSGELLWQAPLQDDGSMRTFFDILFFGDNVIIINDAVAAALNRESGQKLWEVEIDDFFPGMTVIPHKGTAYVCTDDALTALDLTTGRIPWKYSNEDTGNFQNASLSGDTLLMVSKDSFDKKWYFHAVDRKSGQAVWVNDFSGEDIEKYRTRTFTPVPPPILSGETAVFSTHESVYVLSAADGAYLWSLEAGNPVADATVMSGETLFLSVNDKVQALDLATGDSAWAFEAATALKDAILPVPGGLLITDAEGRLYKIGAAQGGAGPDDTDADLLRARAQAFLGRTSDAKKTINELLERKPNLREAWATLFEICRKGDDRPCLSKACANFFLRYPDDPLMESVRDVWTSITPLAWMVKPQGETHFLLNESGGGVFIWGDTATSLLDLKTGVPLLDIPDMNNVSMPPVIHEDLIFAVIDNTLYAIDKSTKEIQWEHTGEYEFEEPLQISGDAVLFINHGVLTSANLETGDVNWTFDNVADWRKSSLDVDSGRVYIVCKSLYALDEKTGKLLWKSNQAETLSVISENLLILESEREVQAVDARTGTVTWTFRNPDIVPIYKSDASDDGVFVITGLDPMQYAPRRRAGGTVYALDISTGAVQWTYDIMSGMISEFDVSEGILFTSMEEGESLLDTFMIFYALDQKTGRLLWADSVSGIRRFPCALDVWGKAALVNKGHMLVAVDKRTGTPLWRFIPPGNAEIGSLYSIREGTLYVGAGGLFALDELTGKIRWAADIGGSLTPAVRISGPTVFYSTALNEFMEPNAIDEIYAFDLQKAQGMLESGNVWWNHSFIPGQEQEAWDDVETLDPAAVTSAFENYVLPPVNSLHEAALYNDVPAAEKFIAQGADVNEVDDRDHTPLYFALLYGRREVAEFLIEHGADMNGTNSDGETLLHRAAAENSLEAAELLISFGADVNTATAQGSTPLMFAVWENNTSMIAFLIEHGADLDIKNQEGYTALFYAVDSRKTGIARILLEGGADANAADLQGSTPLHEATEDSAIEIVRLLLEHGADPNAEDYDGYRPLNIQGAGDWEAVRELLIEYGAVYPDETETWDKEDLPELIQALKDGDTKMRRHAAVALGEIGPSASSAIPALIEALKDEDHKVRENVAYTLGTLGPEAKQAIPALIEALNDEDVYVGSEAAYALGAIGPEAVPALMEALKDESEDMRGNAADAIGQIGPEAGSAVPALIEALKDESENVRWRVAATLGEIGQGAKAAAPALIEALKDENVRLDAAVALISIVPEEAKYAIPVLVETLKEERGYEQQIAAEALGRMGPDAKQAVPDLIRTLADENEYVRFAVVVALGDIKSSADEVVPVLILHLKDSDSDIQCAAARSLGKFGADALPGLAKAQAAMDNPEAEPLIEKVTSFINDANWDDEDWDNWDCGFNDASEDDWDGDENDMDEDGYYDEEECDEDAEECEEEYDEIEEEEEGNEEDYYDGESSEEYEEYYGEEDEGYGHLNDLGGIYSDSIDQYGKAFCQAGLKGDADALLDLILHPVVENAIAADMEEMAEALGEEVFDLREEIKKEYKYKNLESCVVTGTLERDCRQDTVAAYETLEIKIENCGILEMKLKPRGEEESVDQLPVVQIQGKWRQNTETPIYIEFPEYEDEEEMEEVGDNNYNEEEADDEWIQEEEMLEEDEWYEEGDYEDFSYDEDELDEIWAGVDEEYDNEEPAADEEWGEENDNEDETPLLDALKNRNIELARKLIREGADINEVNEYGQTPLHVAVEYNCDNIDIAEYLIEKGADVNSGFEDGWAPLHEAVSCLSVANDAMIELLLSNGAKTDLFIATGIGDLNAVKEILNDGADANTEFFGRTPLQTAADMGYGEIAELLLDYGADINQNTLYGTPLHCAAGSGHPDIVKMLIANGADVNAYSRLGGVLVATPLQMAVEAKDLEIVKLLIANGADVNVCTGSHYSTPLHLTIEIDSLQIAELLIDKGADVNRDCNTITPLWFAAMAGNHEIAELLVASGAAVDDPYLAVELGYLDFLKEWFEKSSPEEIEEINQSDMLRSAAARGHRDIVGFLINRDIVFMPSDDRSSFLPQHLAAMNGHKDIVELLLRNGYEKDLFLAASIGDAESVRKFLEQGYDGNFLMNDGLTPLYGAAMGGDEETVEVLLEYGADLHSKTDTGGWSPLHYAADKGNLPAIKALIMNGADINEQENSGRTPLFLAAMSGEIEAVEMLIQMGADINIGDDWQGGRTPLDYAKEDGREDIAELLLKHGAEE